MPIRSLLPALAVVSLGIGASSSTATAMQAPPIGRTILPGHPGERDLFEDPIALLERLVDRYRSFRRYAERSEVVRVTRDPGTGDPDVTTRTRVRAEIAGDDLKVDQSALLRRINDTVAPADPRSQGASEAELRMLPHLRLRFGDRPLEEFRPGDLEPFRAADVDRVRVEDRELVRVELLSGETEAPEARLRLFIDPKRMLVERVEGDEWLPGGIHQKTTVEIEEVEFDTAGPVGADSADAEPGTSSPAVEEPVVSPRESIVPRGRD